ncbi:hypothetical protein VV02_25285 [Luteipulveratus mongoliensis]|uniref:Peptidase S53 domain-containing protein n=1 Tax=Luteipulveratus mongoliensis TaxID=571913 RepID=A0A0K1JP86_9MICO|nr:hypothetical protein VV02_25285 [Luteipulveratus mongoliensis]
MAALTAAATTLAIIPTAAAFAASGGEDDWKVSLNNSGTSVATGSNQRVVVHGSASTTTKVSATLQLPLRNQAEADKLIAQGVTMTPAQYREKFAPTQAQVDKVSKWAKKNGLTVSEVSRDAGTVSVRSDVKAVNKAFGVTMQRATLGATTGLTVNADPKVPASLGLAGVAGLNTLHRMQTHNTKIGNQRTALAPKSASTKGKKGSTLTHMGGKAANAAGSQDCAAYWGKNVAPTAKKWGQESNYLCGYLPQDLVKMYGTDGAKAQKPAVGILLWGGDTNMKTITNDYMTEAGYPKLDSYTASIAAPDSHMPQCDPDGVKGEHALDVQSSHAIAPAAPIYYYGAASCFDDALTTSLAKMVNEHKVSTISMSFGSTTDAGMTAADKAAWDRPFQQAALTGISVFASTGDWGDNHTRNTGGAKGVGHPASSTNVTAVGGTSVGLAEDGSQPVVTGWENRFYKQPSLDSTAGIVDVTATQTPTSGAGGGVSASYTQPTWQKGVVTGTTSMRALPDVSAIGDPYTGFTIRYTSGGQVGYSAIGGTSLSSPAMAAIVGLSKAQNGKKIGLASPWIYKLKGTGAIKDVNAVNKAGVWAPSNDGAYNLVGFDAKPEGLASAAGWDNVTGVGTPSGASFLANFGK